MSADQNKELVSRIIAEMNRGNWGIADECLAPDHIYHGPFGIETKKLADFKKQMAKLIAAFPDFHMSVEGMIAEGDRVSTLLTCRCTHKGQIWGIAATGRQATFTAVVISQCADGKEVQAWDIWDSASFLQQLGILSP